MNIELFTLIGLGFALGARHAIDWDHIAAITDFISAEDNKRKGFFLSLYYIVGHALINLLLGILAITLGQSLPGWVDGVMERIVGATLVGLGIWLILMIIKNKQNPIVVNRWALLFFGLQKLYQWVVAKITGKPTKIKVNTISNLGPGSACGIGVLHGIGGETATQILLFTTAASVGTVTLGLTAVLAFIAGLFVSQLTIVTILLVGYSKALTNPKIYTWLTVASSLYSIAVGLLFLTGASDQLPPLTL